MWYCWTITIFVVRCYTAFFFLNGIWCVVTIALLIADSTRYSTYSHNTASTPAEKEITTLGKHARQTKCQILRDTKPNKTASMFWLRRHLQRPPLTVNTEYYSTKPSVFTCSFCQGMLYSELAPSASGTDVRSSTTPGRSEQSGRRLGEGGALDSTRMPLVPLIHDSASISHRRLLSIARFSSASLWQA